MSFNIYYKIRNNKLLYVGLAKVKAAKTIKFDSYESCILFEDKLLRIMHNNEKITDKRVKELSEEVNK